MKLFALALATILSFSSAAHADLLLEPYAAYGIGSSKSKAIGGAENKGKVTSPVLGARVAFALPVFFFGVDYSTMLSGKYDPDAAGPNEDVSGSNLYALVGASIPMFRFWAGYGLLNQFKFDSTATNPSTTFYGGTNVKVGVGLGFIPMVSLNLEYIMSSPEKVKTTGYDGSLTGASIDSVSSNAIQIGVSVPFNL